MFVVVVRTTTDSLNSVLIVGFHFEICESLIYIYGASYNNSPCLCDQTTKSAVQDQTDLPYSGIFSHDRDEKLADHIISR